MFSRYARIARRVSFLLIWSLFGVNVNALAQTCPAATNLHASQHDGQTFITWTDAASGVAGKDYRYDLYRSTAGPIKDTSHATLTQKGIFNNSAQLLGPKPFNQTTRQNQSLPMSRIQNNGTPLPPSSGLAVSIDKEIASAYYAVITRDVTNSLPPSPISAANSLTMPVRESPAPFSPVLQMPSSDPSRRPDCCSITGTPHLTLWLRLHGSGGSAPPLGDLQAFWGDDKMGYQDGIQSIFAVYEDHFGTAITKGGTPQLIVAPQDAIWSFDGNSGAETYWYGVKASSMTGDQTPHVFPYTQAKLAFIVPWAIQHYQADPNRIYGISESMGGYGQIEWSLRQPNLFAAIFMRIPILGPWEHIPSLVDTTPNGRAKTVATTDDTLPDGKSYNQDTDAAGWVVRDCSRNLPYVSWSSARNDIGLGNHRMWSYAVQMADALKKCHYGFSFIWNNGVHNNISAGLENTLLAQYQTVFAKDISYPAFTNFSADNNYGNSDFKDGDPAGCVNCGWSWEKPMDTADKWAVTISNKQITMHSTADITPRNLQMFKRAPGASVKWSTSTGQKGAATVDSYGLITVPGVELLPGKATTLTIE